MAYKGEAPEGCTKPTVGRLVGAYIVGGILNREDRRAFIKHLRAGCEACLKKLQLQEIQLEESRFDRR